jgi:hypothetical protein
MVICMRAQLSSQGAKLPTVSGPGTIIRVPGIPSMSSH